MRNSFCRKIWNYWNCFDVGATPAQVWEKWVAQRGYEIEYEWTEGLERYWSVGPSDGTNP